MSAMNGASLVAERSVHVHRPAAVAEHAERLEKLLPELARRLFPSEFGTAIGELPVAQLRVCSVLQAGPRGMSSLGEELGISVSAITQIADRLERAGLVERVAACDDRRAKELRLTGFGEETMLARRERRLKRVEEVLVSLPCEDRGALLDMLKRLIEVSDAVSRAREAVES